MLARHAWKCLSYCQLTNHLHVVVETHHADLGAGMKHLNECYAQSFNRRHGRKGHLFESRYSSVVVDDGYEPCCGRIFASVAAYMVAAFGRMTAESP